MSDSLRQEVLTRHVHSKRHGVEESRRLAAATRRRQKPDLCLDRRLRQQTNVYVSHIFGLLSTRG